MSAVSTWFCANAIYSIHTKEKKYLADNKQTLSKEEKKSMEAFKDSENFKPTTSIKEQIFRRFKKLFD